MLAALGLCFEFEVRFRRLAARRSIQHRYPDLRDLQWDPLTSVIDYPRLAVGANVSISGNAFISGPVTLGHDVMIGPYCALSAGAHRFDIPGKTIRDSGGTDGRGIVLEPDVWLGHGVTVLDGVRIGVGSVVAAGSLVTKSIPPYTLSAGAPCRPLRDRFTEDQLALHHQLLLRAGSPDPLAGTSGP
jgi:acetyltransferase-like isoleucine patch superfamily enzyme